MKKGFTLIELLAVIVILAIIAVIAVPIVLNIIDESKSNAGLRSAGFYLNAAELSIAQAALKKQSVKDGTYNVLESGNICLSYDNENKCKEELKVEVDGQTPSTGSTITTSNGKITDTSLLLNNKTVVKNDKGELVYYINPCKKITGDKTTSGSKYECEVKPGTKYNFYVLSQESDGTTNLIMDRNICSDGTLTEEGKTCTVEWISSSEDGCGEDGSGCAKNDKGPVTAMTYLYNATKSWINIPSINYTYNDKEIQGTTDPDTSYTSFVSVDGIATITSLDGTTTTTIGTRGEPLRARMPIYSSDATKTEVEMFNFRNNIYLYEYLDNRNFYPTSNVRPENNISGLWGYWTLSSWANGSWLAVFVCNEGNIASSSTDSNNGIGVRPVINLKL